MNAFDLDGPGLAEMNGWTKPKSVLYALEDGHDWYATNLSHPAIPNAVILVQKPLVSGAPSYVWFTFGRLKNGRKFPYALPVEPDHP